MKSWLRGKQSQLDALHFENFMFMSLNIEKCYGVHCSILMVWLVMVLFLTVGPSRMLVYTLILSEELLRMSPGCPDK